MNGLLLGKKILVTGGARGLGLAFATQIAQQGARVVIADLLDAQARQEAERLSARGLQVQALALDLMDQESIKACATQSIDRLGGLDGLVNNAAVTDSGGVAAEDLTTATWDRVMHVNVRGSWLMTKACAAALRASTAGAIVNLASDTALWGAPKLLAYVASKGAIIAMTRSLAREFGSDGVTVNAIAPGLTLVEATAYVPEARHRHYIDQRALQREQLPADVCGAVIFCLSDLSRFVTGELFTVNGGFVMH